MITGITGQGSPCGTAPMRATSRLNQVATAVTAISATNDPGTALFMRIHTSLMATTVAVSTAVTRLAVER